MAAGDILVRGARILGADPEDLLLRDGSSPNGARTWGRPGPGRWTPTG
jgi:hypothetical protein